MQIIHAFSCAFCDCEVANHESLYGVTMQLILIIDWSHVSLDVYIIIDTIRGEALAIVHTISCNHTTLCNDEDRR